MVNLRETGAPAERRQTPLAALSSVRGRITTGFLLLALILAAVVGASVWLVNTYRSDLADVQQHARTASQLDQARIDAIYSGASVEQYVLTGDQSRLPDIRTTASDAVANLQKVQATVNAGGLPEQVGRVNDIMRNAAFGLAIIDQMVSTRENGNATAAAASMQAAIPRLNAFWAELQTAAAFEQDQADQLQSQADTTGQVALLSLIMSGVLGVVVGITGAFLIGRSILRPLSRLESTALAVARGNMDARAETGGPRELARLGETLNFMMSELEERERDLLLSNAELKERNRQLTEARAMAATDGLTSLPNHRSFHEAIRRELASIQEDGGRIGVIMLDIDSFKLVNDTLGHLEGDEILRNCATTFCQVVPRDSIYRYGGDEFAVLLPGADLKRTADVAEDLRRAIEERKDTSQRRVTISLGVAAYPETARSTEELIYEADAAMYWAKSAGKNRVGRWDTADGNRRGLQTAKSTARES